MYWLLFTKTVARKVRHKRSTYSVAHVHCCYIFCNITRISQIARLWFVEGIFLNNLIWGDTNKTRNIAYTGKPSTDDEATYTRTPPLTRSPLLMLFRASEACARLRPLRTLFIFMLYSTFIYTNKGNSAERLEDSYTVWHEHVKR